MTDTIFGKIARREIPAEILHETENTVAFNDINPQAPTHILVIPKTSIVNVATAKDSDQKVLGELLIAARDIAKKLGLDDGGYRLVINNGEGAGQSVFHLHVHLLSGRKFTWPPG